jgi:hypothetical protein
MSKTTVRVKRKTTVRVKVKTIYNIYRFRAVRLLSKDLLAYAI